MAQSVVTKCGLVIQHYELECCVKRLAVKVTVRAHNYDQNRTGSTMFIELLILLQPKYLLNC